MASIRDTVHRNSEAGPQPSRARVPLLLAATALGGGIVAGVAVGAMTGPRGVLLGVALGSLVGLIAGRVISREDERRESRTKELDEIIGITHGSIGAGRISFGVPDVVEEAEREQWLREWLTPPPPMAR